MMDTIGFLGCGNMGGAIARAVCKAVDPKKVFLANRTAAKAQALAKELGCKTATNAEVAGDCDLSAPAVLCCAAWQRAFRLPVFRRWPVRTFL